jgi:hypothetical protein
MNMQTSTRQKPNWDKLGKLYLFPVDSPELKSQGIKSQWFLTHQQDDRLFAGHINDRGEWSLCEDKNLTPSHNYQPVDRIWELLSDNRAAPLRVRRSRTFGDRLIEQPKSIANTEKLNNKDDSDHNDEIVQVEKKKKNLVNVGKIPFAPHNRDFYLELDDDELISYEEKERKLQKEDLLDFAQIEFVSGEVSENIPTESISEEEKQTITITEQERSLVESDLQTLLWQGCEADLLDVENQDPNQPWLIELEENTGYIKLISSEDNHTVICIDQDGALTEGAPTASVKGLSLEDADLLMDGLISQNQEQDKQNQISIPELGINIKQEHKQTEWEID